MNIYKKFMAWPERADIEIRLTLRGSGMERCYLPALLKVFALAEQYGIQEAVETNLNRLNVVRVHLNNYVLRHKDHKSARKNGWGAHWKFLLALIETFPDSVAIDPPESSEDSGIRFFLGENGTVVRTVETWDAL